MDNGQYSALLAGLGFLVALSAASLIVQLGHR